MPFAVPGYVADSLRRSTVQVITDRGRMQGNGSGVVLTEERVLTNAHVLHGELTVESWEGERFSASLLRIDRRRDLALLRTPGLKSEPATLADSDQVRVGMPVFAVGNPLGFTGALSSGV